VTIYAVLSAVVFAFAAWQALRDGAFRHAMVLAALSVYGAVSAFLS
jgi:hypothetical protein